MNDIGIKTGSSTAASRLTTRDILLVGLLCVVTGIVLGKDLAVGGLRHGDSSVHAMDGVLIYDWVAAGPDAWRHPMAFALDQYAHYPTLGIGRHYPPGFAVVEAMFFALFGISAVSARLCVVFFGLIAATGTYVFVRPLTDRVTAALAAIILVTMPATTLWGRQTMLEFPTLSILIWGAVAFSWYLRSPTWARLGVLLGVSLLAISFRQTGVLLVVAIALVLTGCAIRRTIRTSHCLCSVAVALIAIVAVVMSFGGHGAKLLRGDPTFPELWSFEALTFYWRAVPQQVGLIVAGSALIGAFVSRRRLGEQWTFLVLWVVVCYVMLTTADYKNPRFFFVGLFPFAVWAGVAAGWILARFANSNARAVVASVTAGGLCAAALAAPVQHRPDYGPVVAANKQRIEGSVVLFSGLRDGDFVFAVRQHIPWRRASVIRGSKLLYTCSARPDLDFVSYVSSDKEVAELMRRLSFKYLFIERENTLRLVEDEMLRSYLANEGAYRHVEAYPLKADPTESFRDRTIDVYEAVQPGTPETDYYDVPIPRINRTVRVKLSG
jgi:hypothetical protein